MIISKKKNFDDLLKSVARYKSFFLLGCSECAALCGTGDENAISEMKDALKNAGKVITGSFIPKTGCQVLGTKIELKPFKEAIERADAILVMSCGAGTQAIVELFKDKPVYPANDTIFLGNMRRFRHFDERCSLCGECILDKTGGICPVTTCPKGLLNGPCGGTNNGMCEVNPDIECAWVRIYNRLKDIDRLDDMREILEPKDYSKHLKPVAITPQKKE